MSDENSQLKLVCIGIVAFDKPNGVDEIQVYPAEQLAFEDGHVPTNKEVMGATTVDISGVPFTATINRTSIMTARWFNDGADGRQTAPDVINGETVKVYRYGDSVEYYWKTMFREPNLRRLEHVVHAYGDIKSGREKFDLESSYGNCFSTKDKYIHIWTSLSDGEPFKYDFKIDTKNGTYEITDNVGNKFAFNSADSSISMENSSGSFVRAVKDKVEILAGSAFAVKTPSIEFDTPDLKVAGTTTTAVLIVGGVDIGAAVAALQSR